MTIAEELRQRREYLTDPAVEWIPDVPRREGTSCLVCDNAGPNNWHFPLSSPAQEFLDNFVGDYAAEGDARYDRPWSAASYNDDFAESREQVLWMLDEAADQAEWEGR